MVMGAKCFHSKQILKPIMLGFFFVSLLAAVMFVSVEIVQYRSWWREEMVLGQLVVLRETLEQYQQFAGELPPTGHGTMSGNGDRTSWRQQLSDFALTAATGIAAPSDHDKQSRPELVKKCMFSPRSSGDECSCTVFAVCDTTGDWLYQSLNSSHVRCDPAVLIECPSIVCDYGQVLDVHVDATGCHILFEGHLQKAVSLKGARIVRLSKGVESVDASLVGEELYRWLCGCTQ
jgi:hypothetical protein